MCTVLLLEGPRSKTDPPAHLPDDLVSILHASQETAAYAATFHFGFRGLGPHENPVSSSRKLAVELSAHDNTHRLAWSLQRPSGDAFTEGTFDTIDAEWRLHVEENTWDKVDGLRFGVAARCE